MKQVREQSILQISSAFKFKRKYLVFSKEDGPYCCVQSKKKAKVLMENLPLVDYFYLSNDLASHHIGSKGNRRKQRYNETYAEYNHNTTLQCHLEGKK